ncbi:MAG: purine-nucleoside phosphorylase [Tissierellia bacterium]|nr:purine-nucleoside phosphorylase [Tissierellia bacterium]
MNLDKWVEQINSRINEQPAIGLILGSGLGELADYIENPVIVKYEELEGFRKSTVQGHKGQFVFGRLMNVPVVAMQGRFHFYEGYSIYDVVAPVRLMCLIGVEQLIVTNAAGGVNESFVPGDLMIISDHLNFTGQNPLIGSNNANWGPRFPDMTNAYDKELITLAKESAKKIGLRVKEGCYMWMTGPTYETPAEIKMARLLGADAIGMSTVPEVIVARHMGVKVLGISCITNMAAGINEEPLSHKDVIITADRIKEVFVKYIKIILEGSNYESN